MEHLLSLLSIIMVNILLSGDNALVIALASRKLPPKQQQSAMIFGSAGAIGLRIGLTFIAVFILKIPYLQIVGGVLLLWIGIKLIGDDHQHEKIKAQKSLWEVVKTIILADIIMSLDNVIAIIGIAKGNTGLLLIGLVISIPIIIWGSKCIGMLIQKWPIVIVIGSIFLGWTAGDMVVSDSQLAELVERNYWLKLIIPSLFAVIVVVVGSYHKIRMLKSKK